MEKTNTDRILLNPALMKSIVCLPRIGWEHHVDCNHMVEVRTVIFLEIILTSQSPDPSLAGWNPSSEFLNVGTENGRVVLEGSVVVSDHVLFHVEEAGLQKESAMKPTCTETQMKAKRREREKEREDGGILIPGSCCLKAEIYPHPPS